MFEFTVITDRVIMVMTERDIAGHNTKWFAAKVPGEISIRLPSLR
jgi:hypothetical protein